MSAPPQIPDWLKQLMIRVAAVGEPEQRAALVAETMTEKTPSVAVRALRCIVKSGWGEREPEGKLILDAVMLAIAREVWAPAHLSAVREAAVSAEDSIVAAMLPLPEDAAAVSDEVSAVPPYSERRPLTLGERKSLARRPNRQLIALAVADPHPDVIERLLANPRMTEADVLSIATKRPGIPEVLKVVALHPKWRLRERVARAVVLNPNTRPAHAVTLVHLLHPRDVAALVTEPKANRSVRRFAAALVAMKDGGR